MRVLNVIDGTGWTGGVEQTMLLAAEMRRLGIDAHVACHGENPVLLESRERNIPIRVYDTGGGRLSRFGSLRGMLREGWDAVIGHKPASIRHLIMPVYTLRKRPLFIGVRRVSFPVSRLTVYRALDHVIAVSRSVRQVLAASGMRRDAVTVIPSGVETGRFCFDARLRSDTRKELGVDDRKVILNLAKFVPEQKGQEVLFDALSSMRESDDLAVLLAGIDTDSVAAAETVRRHGLEGMVRLLGFRRDIPRLICAADLFVFPSLPGLDAIAGSVLQAMACERIVVCSRVGGIPEYVEDGKNGFLAEPGDPGGLTEKLLKGIELNEQERKLIGERARDTVLSGYSTVRMAERYIQLLERMTSAAGTKNTGRRM